MAHEIHISVVSHGHAEHIERLLADLAALPNTNALQLTLTLNIPETIEYPLNSLPFPCKVRRNTEILSFSRNHNLAFNAAPEPDDALFYLILNPDTRLRGEVLEQLANALHDHKQHGIAVVGPRVVDEQGHLQENGRLFPTLGYLILKLLRREPDNPVNEHQGMAQVEWLAGMCLLLESSVYKQLNGFDEHYRLYYEDVDLCLRLRQLGLKAAIVCDAQIVHIGQWKSRRNITHLFWHCGSAVRFLVKLYRFRSRAT